MLIAAISRLQPPLLKDELGMSASQLGILLSAFFWSYTAMQFVSGWLVDRFDVNLIIAAGYLLWSLATATTGIVRGFTILLAMRLDRKSTRLNSSHSQISYAVFCLKKNNNHII